MSIQWYYNCDGRTGGPVSQVQLQLMVNSGALLPHHQVRRGDMPNWLQARSVRGLFSPAENIPQAVPVAAPAPPTAAESDAEPPFGFLDAAASSGPPTGDVFNFFADERPAAPPPAPSKPAAKPAPNRKAPEPPKLVVQEENDEPVALLDDVTPMPPVLPAAIPPASKPPSAAANPYAFDLGLPTATPPAAAAEPEPVKAPEPKAAETAPQVTPEISGIAVELLPDGTLLLVEGKTTFRLQRSWLTAITKFADGSGRTSYLRLSRLDGASVEQRFAAGPTRRGPHSVLCFHAGALHAALRFEGSDKSYRAFAEKVLLLCSASSKPASPAKH